MRLEKLSEAKEVNYDPDEDGFKFGIGQAVALQKRVSMFNLIRRSILANNNKLFELALDDLNEQLERDQKEGKMSSEWSNEKCDFGLLLGVRDNGVSYLKDIRNTE